MVLDEDALEAMLKRQKQQAEAADSKESTQVELTQQTEEFEVYERPSDEPATGAGIRTTPPAEETVEPVMPEAFQEEAEAPTETVDEPAVEGIPEPTPEPEPEAEELVDEPEPEMSIEPELEQPPEEPEAEPEPVRPRVWPPLSSSKEAAPEPAATPMPEPEPVPRPTPEPAPVLEPEPEAADPHSHAHADLSVNGDGIRVAIVQALFNQDITDMMAELAIAKAKKRGAKVTHHITVPGVFDLPLLTARLLERDDVDCAVVIGVVVQGETAHDDVITHATARSLQQLSLDVDKPIGFGVTGPGMTWKQAEARVANGAHALDAALAQVAAIKSL